jgi:hypothetical protein
VASETKINYQARPRNIPQLSRPPGVIAPTGPGNPSTPVSRIAAAAMEVLATQHRAIQDQCEAAAVTLGRVNARE